MKKLLLLSTILILVSCQPSELDRCIEVNMEFEDDYIEKKKNHKNWIKNNYPTFNVRITSSEMLNKLWDELPKEEHKTLRDRMVAYDNSITEIESDINECASDIRFEYYNEIYEKPENIRNWGFVNYLVSNNFITREEAQEFYDNARESCSLSFKNRALEKASLFCNAQGIY